MRCAADIDDVGCPDPAAVVHRMLSTASCAAKLVPELCPVVHAVAPVRSSSGGIASLPPRRGTVSLVRRGVRSSCMDPSSISSFTSFRDLGVSDAVIDTLAKRGSTSRSRSR